MKKLVEEWLRYAENDYHVIKRPGKHHRPQFSYYQTAF